MTGCSKEEIFLWYKFFQKRLDQKIQFEVSWAISKLNMTSPKGWGGKEKRRGRRVYKNMMASAKDRLVSVSKIEDKHTTITSSLANVGTEGNK